MTGFRKQKSLKFLKWCFKHKRIDDHLHVAFYGMLMFVLQVDRTNNFGNMEIKKRQKFDKSPVVALHFGFYPSAFRAKGVLSSPASVRLSVVCP